MYVVEFSGKAALEAKPVNNEKLMEKRNVDGAGWLCLRPAIFPAVGRRCIYTPAGMSRAWEEIRGFSGGGRSHRLLTRFYSFSFASFAVSPGRCPSG